MRHQRRQAARTTANSLIGVYASTSRYKDGAHQRSLATTRVGTAASIRVAPTRAGCAASILGEVTVDPWCRSRAWAIRW